MAALLPPLTLPPVTWALLALVLLALALLALALPTLLLCAQLAAAFPRRRPRRLPARARPPLAVLVPAHNEAAGIACTLAAIQRQLTAGDQLLVVADNCDDDTAAIARATSLAAETSALNAAGRIVVLERQAPHLRGKAYALAFGLQWLARDPPAIVVCIDADCTLDAHALDWLADRCAVTGLPAQARYLMHAPPVSAAPAAPLPARQLPARPLAAGSLAAGSLAAGSPAAGSPAAGSPAARSPAAGSLTARSLAAAPASAPQLVAEFAWSLKNSLRALGRERLGMACQLSGSGMAFPWPVLQDLTPEHHLAEDLALGLQLASRGHAPVYCHEATVHSTFAGNAVGARSQRLRWEHGHMNLLIHQGPRHLIRAIRHRRWHHASLAMDLCIPPLSLLIMLNAAAAIVAIHTLPWLALPPAILAVTLLATWATHGRDLLPARRLPGVLVYILAKLPLHLRKRQRDWVATRRD